MARDFTDILSAVWAANALTTIPNPPIPGQAYRNTAITDGDLSNGQQYSEVYDSARYNQLLYLLSGCLKMLMETGLPEWSAEQNYQQNAYTIGSDGKLYGPAKKASGPDNGGAVDPVTDAVGEATTWTLSLPDFEAPLTFDAAEGKVKLSVGNTTTVTGNKLEAKLDANGGLGFSSAGIKVTPSNGVTVNSNGVGAKAGNGIVVSASGIAVKPVSGSPVTVTANGVNVSTFTPPTAIAPGKAGLVPGPEATPENELLNRFLSAKGFMKIDPSALFPSAESAEKNKTTLALGGELVKGLEIDQLRRSGWFAGSFTGTLPEGVTDGVLLNLLVYNNSDQLYYRTQLLIAYNDSKIYRRGSYGFVPGGTITSDKQWWELGAFTPLPRNGEGMGQFMQLSGINIQLPDRGTWIYYHQVFTAAGIPLGNGAGVVPGGTVVASNYDPLTVMGSGWAWRIQ